MLIFQKHHHSKELLKNIIIRILECFITHKIQAKVKNLLEILYLELSLLIDVKKSHFVHDFDLFNFCPPHNTLCVCTYTDSHHSNPRRIG